MRLLLLAALCLAAVIAVSVLGALAWDRSDALASPPAAQTEPH